MVTAKAWTHKLLISRVEREREKGQQRNKRDKKDRESIIAEAWTQTTNLNLLAHRFPLMVVYCERLSHFKNLLMVINR